MTASGKKRGASAHQKFQSPGGKTSGNNATEGEGERRLEVKRKVMTNDKMMCEGFKKKSSVVHN
jgi:hypothetical protein